ncbi:MAG: hypothetical protein JXA33_24465 [Anaerolineae bacterium]|nr:hypothetical protein [Anaerolineae bacterium]
MTDLTADQETKQKITAWLEELPPQSLTVVAQFVEFLRQKARQQHPLVVVAEKEAPPYLYPTVVAPTSSLEAWGKLLDAGYEGDALADTEALYDEV